MNAGIIAVICLLCFFLGYRFYSRFLARQIYRIYEEIETPAHTHCDCRHHHAAIGLGHVCPSRIQG